MLARMVLVLTIIGAFAAEAEAQQEQPVDSLVTHWIEHGPSANWQPHELFTGCPRLQEWQNRGIARLLTASLSPERTRHLAMSWSIPLKGCQDPRLEQWYFKHINAAIERREPAGTLFEFWSAMRHGDSPRIREYLGNIMLDKSKPESYRNSAGVALFVRFGPEERLSEYLRAFDTRRMPFEISVGQTELLLKHNADRLLQEVGNRVGSNPELADQLAFTGIVEGSPRYASQGARHRLGGALEAGLTRPGLTEKQRHRLEGSVRFLKQQGS
jgi:hypothetical protein